MDASHISNGVNGFHCNRYTFVIRKLEDEFQSQNVERSTKFLRWTSLRFNMNGRSLQNHPLTYSIACLVGCALPPPRELPAVDKPHGAINE
jgi:hypothetical protein